MADPATGAQRQSPAVERMSSLAEAAGEPPELDTAEEEEEELVAFLERDQLVIDRSVPVPPAQLGVRARTALWALRVLVTVVSAMVVYAFVDGLH